MITSARPYLTVNLTNCLSLLFVIQGLSLEHKEKLLAVANEEAEAYMGMPGIYAVCEAIRTWLGDNNVKGLDDVSMHAQMLRKQMEEEQSKVRSSCCDTVCYVCLLSFSNQSSLSNPKSRYFITNTGSLSFRNSIPCSLHSAT